MRKATVVGGDVPGPLVLRWAAALLVLLAALALPAGALAAPPTTTASFGPAGVAPNVASTLTITITNADPSVTMGSVSFTDTLPANVSVETPNGLTSTCGGTATATAGSDVVSLSGGTIATASSCTVSVQVVSPNTGLYLDSTGPITSDAGTGVSASAQLSVANPPSISKLFDASTVPQGGQVGVSFHIVNPNSNSTPPDSDVTLTGVSFTDALPAGLVVASPSQGSSDCGGTVTAVPGSSSISFSGGTIAPALPPDNTGGACNIAVELLVTGTGTLNNTTGPVSANESGAGATSNTASLTVGAAVLAPTLTQVPGASAIPVGGSTSLTFTLTNPNASTTLYSAGFDDPLPPGLAVATPNGATGTCLTTDNGFLTASPGSNRISLSAVLLPAAASCTLTVSVTGTKPAAPAVNTTGQPNATYDDGSGNFLLIKGTPATASITVVGPPQIAEVFASSAVKLGGVSTLTFAIANPNTTSSLSGIAFTEPLPAGLQLASPNGLTGSCGGGTVTATAGSGSIALSGATLAPSASCTFSVGVAGVVEGAQTASSGPVSSIEGGNGASASATIFVGSAPTVTSSFSPQVIRSGGTTTLLVAIANPNHSTTLTHVSLTDTLTGGLQVLTPASLTTGCGIGASANIAGGTQITISGVALAPGASCQLSVQVTGTKVGFGQASTGPVSSAEAGSGASTTTSVLVLLPSNQFTVGPRHVSKDGTVTFSLTLPGPGTVDLLETAWIRDEAGAARALRPGPHRFVFASKHLSVHQKGRITVHVRPNGRGRHLLRHHRHPVRINLWITFTPSGGAPRQFGIFGLEVTR
jgi:hypothetical protein